MNTTLAPDTDRTSNVILKAKILIIDDDYGPRESLRILLKYDYEVLVASSVSDGVGAAQKPPDRYPLSSTTACLDAPAWRAWRICARVDDSVSIIMLTGYGTLETACEAFRNQATDFMTKPPDTDAMLEAVAKNVALTRGKRARANVSRECGRVEPQPLRRTERNPPAGQARTALRRDHPRSGQPAHHPDLLRGTGCKARSTRCGPRPGPRWMEALGYIQMIKKSVQHCCSLSDAWRQVRDDIAQNRETVLAATFMREAVESLQPMSAISDVTLTAEFDGDG